MAIYTIKVTNPNRYKVFPPTKKIQIGESVNIEITMKDSEHELKDTSYEKDKFKIVWCYLDDSDNNEITSYDLHKLNNENAETHILLVNVKKCPIKA